MGHKRRNQELAILSGACESEAGTLAVIVTQDGMIRAPAGRPAGRSSDVRVPDPEPRTATGPSFALMASHMNSLSDPCFSTSASESLARLRVRFTWRAVTGPGRGGPGGARSPDELKVSEPQAEARACQ